MNIEVDPITAAISIIALITSTLSAYLSIKTARRKLSIDAYTYVEQVYAQIEMQLKDTPEALRFHGITNDDLKKADLTAKDISYLLTNLTAGCMEARALNQKEHEVEITDYKLRILQSEATRKAWPILKKMMGDSPCRQKIDKIIKAENKKQATST